MKTYRVKAIETVYSYIDVLAENEDEALEKAEDADGSWFTEESSSWECGDATEIDKLGTVINSKYEDGGSVSLMETNHDYDFIAAIDNGTDKVLRIEAYTEFIDEQVTVNPHDWVGLLANDEERSILKAIKAGDFKVMYV